MNETKEQTTDAVFGTTLLAAVEEHCRELRGVAVDCVKFVRHNKALIEAIDTGGDFRIAFRKKGETGWTRVAFPGQELLRNMAINEVLGRQIELSDYVENLFGD